MCNRPAKSDIRIGGPFLRISLIRGLRLDFNEWKLCFYLSLVDKVRCFIIICIIIALMVN